MSGSLFADDTRRRPWGIIFLVLIVATVVLGFRLGEASLWDIDEPIYAEIAREMVVRGDWVGPYFNFAPRFDKPPLVLWITAAMYRLFGVNETTTRLSTLLFTLALLALVVWMGWRWGGRRAALASGLILATNLGVFVEGRLGIMDTALSFWIALALWAFWLAWEERRSPTYLLLGLALALGILTKGPVVLILVGGTVLGYFLWEGWGCPRAELARVGRELKRPYVWGGLALMLLVALPWHLVMWRRFGTAFTASYFGYHMFTRFLSGIEQHGYPWYFYLFVLAFGFLPWSGFLPAALGRAISLARRSGGERSSEGIMAATGEARQARALRLLLLWTGVVFLFFSLARTKLPGYILPLFPAVALLVGLWWARLWEAEERYAQGPGTERRGLPANRFPRALAVGLGVIFTFCLLFVVVLLALRPQVPAPYLPVYPSLFFFPTLMGAAALLVLLLGFFGFRPRAAVILILLVVTFGVGMGQFTLRIMPALERFKPVRPLTRQLAPVLEPGDEVGTLLGDASTTFYLRRRVNYLGDLAQARAFLAGGKAGKRRFLLLWRRDYPALKMPPGHVWATTAEALVVGNVEKLSGE